MFIHESKQVEGAHFLPTPKEVPALRHLGVRSVVAGWGHSAVLTERGEVCLFASHLVIRERDPPIHADHRSFDPGSHCDGGNSCVRYPPSTI